MADETSAFPGGADPGRGAERLAERLVGGEPAANQSVRIGDLRDVAWGPSVETGADVPSYSGGLAAWLVVSDAGFSL